MVFKLSGYTTSFVKWSYLRNVVFWADILKLQQTGNYLKFETYLNFSLSVLFRQYHLFGVFEQAGTYTCR